MAFWEKSSWLESLIHFTGLLVMHYYAQLWKQGDSCHDPQYVYI